MYHLISQYTDKFYKNMQVSYFTEFYEKNPYFCRIYPYIERPGDTFQWPLSLKDPAGDS